MCIVVFSIDNVFITTVLSNHLELHLYRVSQNVFLHICGYCENAAIAVRSQMMLLSSKDSYCLTYKITGHTFTYTHRYTTAPR